VKEEITAFKYLQVLKFNG